MTKGHPDRKAFHRAVQKHIEQLLATGVTRPQMQAVLGVTKQAISSYVTGRTTPKPYIIRRLLDRWPSKKVSYRGMPVTAEHFDIPAPGLSARPLQSELFAILTAIKRNDLKIEVDRAGETQIDLRVSIRIAG